MCHMRRRIHVSSVHSLIKSLYGVLLRTSCALYNGANVYVEKKKSCAWSNGANASASAAAMASRSIFLATASAADRNSQKSEQKFSQSKNSSKGRVPILKSQSRHSFSEEGVSARAFCSQKFSNARYTTHVHYASRLSSWKVEKKVGRESARAFR